MKPIIIIFVLLFCAGLVVAQQAPTQFHCLEDVVKPSMNTSYRAFLKKVKDTYEKNGVTMTYNIFFNTSPLVKVKIIVA